MEALKTLAPVDYAAVVAYDTEAFVLTRVTPARDIERFAGDISRLRADGNTALYDGVELGAREIERLVESGYIPRIILLSDGLANVGPSSSTELAALGRKLARREMTITTIGLGLDYDEDLMTALASESGGNAYFARRPDSLKDIFRRDMEDAVALSGRHVSITLSCGPAVRPIRAIGRSGRIEGDGIEVDIDNLYGTEKYVIFELEVPASESGTTQRLGTVKMEYTDPSTGEAVKLESPLEIGYAKNAGDVEKHRDIEITSQAEMAKNAEILDEAVNLADGGKSAEASQMLRERAQYLANQGYAASAPMQSDISYFNSLASDLSEGEMSNAARKSTVNRVYIQKNQQADIKESPDGSQNK
jgi:Ca-activated chloride channel family protein